MIEERKPIDCIPKLYLNGMNRDEFQSKLFISLDKGQW